MLQILREKAQGLITWFIVLMIATAFAFFGLSDYFTFKGHSNAAKVNGERISWRTVDGIYERVSRQYGGQADERSLKNQILMGLVQRAALMSRAKVLGFQVGEDQLRELLLQIPAFQIEGQFSKEQYLKVLSQASYSDASFRKELLQDALLGQLEQGLMQSSFILQNELADTVALLDEKRDFGYMLIPARASQKDIKIPLDDLKAYYEDHKVNFIKSEQVVLEYVELSLEQLAKEIKPTKQDALLYYNEHQTLYTTPERVQARHILIAVPAEEDASSSEAAKSKIDSLLNDLKKGADFSKVAAKASEDPASAEKGGDLGWFIRGQMVPEFEKVAFALQKPGDISEPVRTQFGYHLIQLIDHKESQVRPFNEVHNLIEEQIKMEKAQALFAEKAEQFAKMAFEQASLTPIAEQFGLAIKETSAFSRQGGKGISNLPEVIKMAFSNEILEQGRNSEPVKVSENSTAIFRLKKYYPAVQQTFEEVQKDIHDLLVAEREKVELKNLGEELVRQLKNGAKPHELAKQHKLEWVIKNSVVRTPTGKDRNVVAVAFQLPNLEEEGRQVDNIKGFMLPSGEYLVLELNKVIPGQLAKIDPETERAYRQGLRDFSGQIEYTSYANQALQEAKVKLSEEH